jgi:hypothetical protein
MTGVGTKAVTGGSMVRLAVTGHRGLDPTTTGLVDAGPRMIQDADRLMAGWDGQPARGSR